MLAVDCAFALGRNAECRFSVRQLQRFVNRVAGELRRASAGNQLLTVGSWSYCASAAAGPAHLSARNLWDAHCLVAAGNDRDGVLDVVQAHAYPKHRTGQAFSEASPMQNDAGTFHSSKRMPVIVGEISSRWDAGRESAGRRAEAQALNANACNHSLGCEAFRRVQRGLGPMPATASPLTNADPMARVYTTLHSRGYAGVFGWAYTCDPQADNGCVGHAELAAGLRSVAGQAKSDWARLPPRAHVRGIRAYAHARSEIRMRTKEQPPPCHTPLLSELRADPPSTHARAGASVQAMTPRVGGIAARSKSAGASAMRVARACRAIAGHGAQIATILVEQMRYAI